MNSTDGTHRSSNRRSLPFPSPVRNSPSGRRIFLQKRADVNDGVAAILTPATVGANQRVEIVEVPEVQRPLQLGDLVSPGFLQKQTPFLASFVFHLFLMIVLSLLLIQMGLGRGAIVLEAVIPQPPDELLDLSFMPSDEDNLENDLQDDNSNPLLAASNVVFNNLTEELATQVENQSGKKSGTATAGNAAEFFGTRVSGHKFVYVLDRSQSMGNDPARKRTSASQTFTRFNAASDELLRSVGQLTEDQEFYVLLFSTSTVRMFDDKSVRPTPVKATEENKRKLATWLRGTRVGGGTDPGASLELAFKIEPDAIFMLSDGEFGGHVPGSSDDAMKVVRNQNLAKVAIHTVALEDAASKHNMRQIAAWTGGEFKFVTLTDSLTSILRESDDYSRTNAYRRLPSVMATKWHDRLRIAKQAIVDLSSDDRQLQKAAEDALHFLSFDIFKSANKQLDPNVGSPPWSIQSVTTNPHSKLQICNAWTTAWNKGRRLQRKLAEPQPDDNAAIDQAEFEIRLLVTFGDFSNHRSLAQAGGLSNPKLPPGQQTFLAQSLVKFQNQYDDADLFVMLSSPDVKKQSAALQSLIGKQGIEFSWKDRYELANTIAIPLLRSSDLELQAAAESSLHFLSFDLFAERIPSLHSENDSENLSSEERDPQRIIGLWQAAWQHGNQLQIDQNLPTSLEAEDFEEQMLAYLGDFARTNDIRALKTIASSDVPIVQQIALAKTIVNFQHQYGATNESRDLLKQLCNQIYPERKYTKKYWEGQVTSEAWRLRLKNAIRQRKAAARRMFFSWKRMDDSDRRKSSVAQKLIDRYPETEYAATVRQANQP